MQSSPGICRGTRLNRSTSSGVRRGWTRRARARHTCRRPDRAPSGRLAPADLAPAAPDCRGPASPDIPTVTPCSSFQIARMATSAKTTSSTTCSTSGSRFGSRRRRCADFRVSSARFAAWASGPLGSMAITCSHALSRRQDPACRTRARCRDSAASSRAWDRASAMPRTAPAPCRADSCSSSRRRGRCSDSVVRRELHRLLVPRDRVVVAFGVEVQVPQLHARLRVVRFSFRDRLQRVHFRIVDDGRARIRRRAATNARRRLRRRRGG